MGADVYRFRLGENALSFGDPISTILADEDSFNIVGLGPEGRLVSVSTAIDDFPGESTVLNINPATGEVVGEFGTYEAWSQAANDRTGTTLIVSDSSAVNANSLRFVADGRYDPTVDAYIAGAAH